MSAPFSREDRPSLYCVELRTAHWEAAVQWYRQILGLRVLVRVVDDGYALLEAGDTRLALIARESPGDSTRRISLAFEVKDLRAISARLQAIDPTSSAAHPNSEGLREVNTTDPDGNRIRLFCWPRGRE